jgi:general secretion pathway protein G
MVVLLIIALLGSIAAPEVIKHLRHAKSETAHIQVDALAAAVDFFNTDTGRYPTQQEGLDVLVKPPADTPKWDGPYIKKAISLVDPWNARYLYKIPGEHGAFDIYSLGADGAVGGSGEAADVGNW